MDEIIGEFLVESYEGLDQMDQNLVILEESPGDVAILKEVFRTLHTIKGTCGFLGFGHLEKVAHAGENLLSLLRDGKRSMTPEIADALLATVDAIREILATIDQTEEEGEPDNAAVIATLARLSSDGEPAEEPASPDQQDEDPIAAPEAPLEQATSDPARIGDLLVDAGAADRTDVEIAAVEQQLGDDRKLGRILVDDGRAKHTDVESAATTQRTSASDSTIRVDVALLDRLMNLVGELVLSRNQIIQLAGEQEGNGFGPPAQRLNLITSELQEGVMKTRMQPINNVWAKLPRVVRDLSQQMGKKLRIEMIGKDTELDRTIIEAIKDPLTHIVRNTVDHGIEPPEEREALGKDPEGLLLLRASHEGGQVNIEISDDGRGISVEPLKAKGIERGFITAETAARMSDSEIVQLIFRPGFSTAGKVSNV